MSDIFTLLSSIITKLKTVARSVPTKVSELEQDVTVSWNDLADKPVIPEHTWASLPDKPFGEIPWEIVKENLTVEHDTIVYSEFYKVFCKEQTLKIVIDGTEYITPVIHLYGTTPGYFAGNAQIFGDEYSDQYGTLPDAPFHIRAVGLSDMPEKVYMKFADQAAHVVTIYQQGEMTTLDEQFIPDTIARTEDIPEHTWASLPDKPFQENIEQIQLFNEQGIALERNGFNGFRNYKTGLPCEYEATIGDTLTIVANGVSYQSVVKEGEIYRTPASSPETVLYVGNKRMMSGSGNTNDPFLIIFMGSNTIDILVGQSIEEEASADLAISLNQSNITPLDPKYLPPEALLESEMGTIVQAVIEALPSAEGGSF